LRARVIFVVGGDNEAGSAHEILKMRNRCFKYSVELVQAEGSLVVR